MRQLLLALQYNVIFGHVNFKHSAALGAGGWQMFYVHNKTILYFSMNIYRKTAFAEDKAAHATSYINYKSGRSIGQHYPGMKSKQCSQI